MKKYINTLIFLVCAFAALAQAPQKFNYQAVARNAQGTVLPNQNVKIRASILDGSANGTSQYSETHSVTTSQLGLFNLAIGGGTVVSGNFTNITWANGDKYLKIEMDATGGNNFSLVGTSQLLSVPYALNAGNGSQWKEAISQPTAEEGIFYNSGNYQGQVRIGTNKAMFGALNIKGFTVNSPGSQFHNWSDLIGFFDKDTLPAWHIGLQPNNTFGLSESGVSSTASFSVTKGGNVGINTWNPAGKFEIAGEYDAANNITPTFRIGGFGGAINHLSTNTPMVFNVAPDAGYGFVFRSTEFGNLGNYTDLVRITPNGRVGIGQFAGGAFDPSPFAKLHINDGDIYLDNATNGVIMKSPNGGCWRMTVSDSGQPVFTSIACPQ